MNEDVEMTTVIHPSARLASSVKILGEINIGKNVIIHDFVAIYPKVTIEESVEIIEGAIIGKPPKGARAIARKVTQELR